MGVKGSTVMLTANGKDITAEEYFFWLAQQVDTAAQYFSAMGMETDWDMELGDTTAGEGVKEAAKQTAVMYSVVAAQGEELGYTYSEEDKDAYQEDLAAAKEQLGAMRPMRNTSRACASAKAALRRSAPSAYIYNHIGRGDVQEGKP